MIYKDGMCLKWQVILITQQNNTIRQKCGIITTGDDDAIEIIYQQSTSGRNRGNAEKEQKQTRR
jgi:hypothetical protein